MKNIDSIVPNPAASREPERARDQRSRARLRLVLSPCRLTPDRRHASLGRCDDCRPRTGSRCAKKQPQAAPRASAAALQGKAVATTCLWRSPRPGQGPGGILWPWRHGCFRAGQSLVPGSHPSLGGVQRSDVVGANSLADAPAGHQPCGPGVPQSFAEPSSPGRPATGRASNARIRRCARPRKTCPL